MLCGEKFEDANKKDIATVYVRNNSGLHLGARDGEKRKRREIFEVEMTRLVMAWTGGRRTGNGKSGFQISGLNQRKLLQGSCLVLFGSCSDLGKKVATGCFVPG